MRYNLILDTDSYKASHYLQYPPGTTAMFSYIESRGGRYPNTVFFGLQYLLKQYLCHPVEAWMVEEAKTFFAAHGEPFNDEGWMYIVHQHQGRLPIKIRAVPEGRVVPVHNVLMTIESTDPKVFWLVSWLETMLLRVWYPTTVATQSWHLKGLIYKALARTSDDPEGEISFKLHDFGARGVSSMESSGVGGMAHLVNFQGSDTVQGVLFANHYYHHPMSAYSIPAAEHSTITSWGRSHELAAYRNMLTQFAQPGRILAVVSDSYDLWEAVEHLWGEVLREEIINSGATLVIRPDSGNPVEVLGKVLVLLDQKFGSTHNQKGYKVLNQVRVIQGDGINEQSLQEILLRVEELGFSISNLAFGMGGALLQRLNRDTQKFAMKCSEVTVNDEDIAVYKDPITDPGKKSKQGRLELIRSQGEYQTVPANSLTTAQSELVTVYEDGALLREYTLEEVRAQSRLT